MLKLVSLLREKIGCLEKFLKLNEHALVAFCDGNYTELENFHHSRECLLEMISVFDRDFEKEIEHLDISQLTLEQKKIVCQLLDLKDDLVKQIVSQDLQIISMIELEKSNIIKELKQIGTNKSSLRKFKTKSPQKRLVETA